MSSRRLLLAPLTLVLLAGCDTIYPQSGSPDPGFGEAFKYNAAIQTVDPDPVYPEGGAQPGDNGEKAAEATERYRKGNTKPVQVQSASGGSSGPQ